jgi:hypothetical protein
MSPPEAGVPRCDQFRGHFGALASPTNTLYTWAHSGRRLPTGAAAATPRTSRLRGLFHVFFAASEASVTVPKSHKLKRSRLP